MNAAWGIGLTEINEDAESITLQDVESNSNNFT